jgi:hypothetical protein
MSFISSACTPTTIYLFISIISLIFSILFSFNLISIIIKLIFIMFWTWLLNTLCNNGLTIVSWFLVVLPFIAYFMNPF